MYEDTFGKILSDYTGINVYNWGVDGGSPRELLYILRNKQMIKDILFSNSEKNINYIIYVFFPDQLPRLYSDVYKDAPAFYRNKNNQLVYFEEKKFLWKSSIYRKLRNFYAYKIVSRKESYDLFCIYINEINKEIKSIFGDETKLVILLYDFDLNETKYLEQLDKKEIIIINLNELVGMDLSDPKYKVWDKVHPNRAAWELIVPALTKRLNLNYK